MVSILVSDQFKAMVYVLSFISIGFIAYELFPLFIASARYNRSKHKISTIIIVLSVLSIYTGYNVSIGIGWASIFATAVLMPLHLVLAISACVLLKRLIEEYTLYILTSNMLALTFMMLVFFK